MYRGFETFDECVDNAYRELVDGGKNTENGNEYFYGNECRLAANSIILLNRLSELIPEDKDLQVAIETVLCAVEDYGQFSFGKYEEEVK